MEQKTQLSDKEKRVLELYCQGKSLSQIAEIICRSSGTVDSHLQRIKKKLKIDETWHLRLYGVLTGMIPVPSEVIRAMGIETRYIRVANPLAPPEVVAQPPHPGWTAS